MELKDTFDTVAAAYDAARPGYPDALFDDLAAIAGLRPGSRVLELGCGSGQATDGFVARGYAVLGVEPGAALAALAQQRFSANPAVQFVVSSFETWPLEAGAFDLVAAAQSWHWIDPELRFAKAADALRPGGYLAVFGHTPLPSDAYLALAEPIYRRWVPGFWGQPGEAWYLPNGPIPSLFAASGRFESLEHRAYRWTRHYTLPSFMAWLGTISAHTRLPAEQRTGLFTDLEAALAVHGGEIETDWATTLHIARVA